MHQLKSFVIASLSCLLLYLCSNGLQENVETVNLIGLSDSGFTLKSLEEINEPLLSNQLTESKAHLKAIVAKKFQLLLNEHPLDDLTFDTDHILVAHNDDQSTTYAIQLMIPQENLQTAFHVDAAVKLEFAAGKNVGNELRTGYQMEFVVNFDQDGNITNSRLATEGHQSSKPFYLTSKTPKNNAYRHTNHGYSGWSSAYGSAPDWVVLLYARGQTTN